MRPIAVFAKTLTPERAIGRVLCQNVTITRNGRRQNLLKGSLLTDDDVALLRELGDRELHLIELEPGDLHEDRAAVRIAQAIAGPGLELSGPAESQVKLIASQRGLFEVKEDILKQVNALPWVGVFTLYDGQVVDEGKKVAGVKVAPLVVPKQVVAEAEAICHQAGPVMAVRPFRPLRVAVLSRERLRGDRRDRYEREICERIEWLGGEITSISIDLPDDVETIARAVQQQLRAGADLIILAGTNSTDPLDTPLRALLAAGGSLVRQGVPAHPGSTYWVAQIEEKPVLGVGSCGMFSDATVFDLLLPRFFAGLPLDVDFLASLGHGGLLTSEMRFRFPPYGRRRVPAG